MIVYQLIKKVSIIAKKQCFIALWEWEYNLISEHKRKYHIKYDRVFITLSYIIILTKLLLGSISIIV
jgi:hypothetical protein